MRISVPVIFLLFAAANAALATAQTLKNSAAKNAPARDVVSTRELERINWMEFKEAVPSKVQTVLLPTGTLEPHGVINNGADITAPVAMARAIAPRVNALIAPVQPGQGYPKFDQKKAGDYFRKINDKVAGLINDVVRKWDMAGL